LIWINHLPFLNALNIRNTFLCTIIYRFRVIGVFSCYLHFPFNLLSHDCFFRPLFCIVFDLLFFRLCYLRILTVTYGQTIFLFPVNNWFFIFASDICVCIADIIMLIWDGFADYLLLLFLSWLESVNWINARYFVLVLLEGSFVGSQSAKHALLLLHLYYSLAFDVKLGSFVSWLWILYLNYIFRLLMSSLSNSLNVLIVFNLFNVIFKFVRHLVYWLRWVTSY